MKKSKRFFTILFVVGLFALAIYSRSLTLVSTLLLIGAAGYALLNKEESSDRRRLPWQTYTLAGLSLVLYLIGWFVIGE